MNLGNRWSQHPFAQVPQANIARSRFDRSYAAKDTFDFDYLTPCFVEEVLPGDTINLTVKNFARLATQVVPLMDNMYIDFFFFFVPNRLVWDNWEKFNGAQDNPGESTDYLIPQIEAPTGGFVNGSVYDHLGIPTQVEGTGDNKLKVSALPFRGMNLIWNEWFRDQNIESSLTVPTGNGPDSTGNYSLLSFNMKHDYFSSALPFPQKGNAVELPLGQSAPVYGPDITSNSDSSIWQTVGNVSGDPYTGMMRVITSATPTTRNVFGQALSSGTEAGDGLTAGTKEQYEAVPTAQPMYADLSDATAATINQFREAIMLQSILELDARGGTRYTEILKATLS